jgi:large subunit ribosomal protein L13
MQRTYSAKPAEITPAWYLVDAANKPLGRVASDIARVLRGKHKPTYTPHVDTGDFVVVVNADKVALTGRKETDKIYWRHTLFPGGERATAAGKMRQEKPEEMITSAVKGMLPKGPLGYAMLKKMKCYAGAAHPHTAQQPRSLDL